jgi:hypothetical protein
VLRQADHVEGLARASASLSLWHLADPQPVLDVVHHGHVREQRVVLEHRVHVARVGRTPGDVAAAQLDAAGVGQVEAGDQPQCGRLSGPRGAEHREELAGGDVKLDAVDRGDVAEALDQTHEPHVRSSVRRRRAVRGAGGARQLGHAASVLQRTAGSNRIARRCVTREDATSYGRLRPMVVTAADIKGRLEELESERACALQAGLGSNRLYMAGLEEEIEAVRAAYVGSAVVEIACLRADLGAPLRG